MKIVRDEGEGKSKGKKEKKKIDEANRKLKEKIIAIIKGGILCV